jgi:aspartate/methionine/tyrosine aminotransferase
MDFGIYPFKRLNNLLKDIIPNPSYSLTNLSIGEPKFDTPDNIKQECISNIDKLNKYPLSAGIVKLKDSMIEFNKKRLGIELKSSQIVPTLGTREVLFNFPIFYLHDKENPKMGFTNPFYQIYKSSAIMTNSSIYYIDLIEENNFKPIIDESKISKCDLVIINFPNNPTTSTLDINELANLVELALKYNFVLLNDECYLEIYDKTPPPSLLNASIKVGNKDFKNILVCNSISKRNSAPSLRSGFLAGDENIIKPYMTFRTQIGCAQPLPLQYASSIAWEDEESIKYFNSLYTKNKELARSILGIDILDSTFYLWIKVENALEFTKELFRDYHIKVLPGAYLGENNISDNFIRIALVEQEDIMKKSLDKIKKILKRY